LYLTDVVAVDDDNDNDDNDDDDGTKIYCCVKKQVLTAHCRLLCDKNEMIRDWHQWRQILGRQWLQHTEGQIRFHFGYPCNLIKKITPITLSLLVNRIQTSAC